MNSPATASHYPAATVKERSERHTLAVLVDNEPGVLARVIGLFSGRGYNIDSLTVSETEHEKHLSRITIVTTGTPMVIEQIRHQLERLVQVQRVVDLTESARPAIERELAMVKVRGKGDHRVEALRLADAFRARVIDASIESFIFEITGAQRQDRPVRRPDAAARAGRGVAHRRGGDFAAARRGCDAAWRPPLWRPPNRPRSNADGACPGTADPPATHSFQTKRRPTAAHARDQDHARLLRPRRRPEPDQGQEGRHHRLWQPGPRPCAEPARQRASRRSRSRCARPRPA